jgi:hypothetical protein
VISIQLAVLAADQEHSRERPTDTVPVPPEGPNVVGEPWTVGWQRERLLGAVTFVVVELPHPATVNAMMAEQINGRARDAGHFTSQT